MSFKSCPISLKSIDENIVRATALIISILSIIYILTQARLIIVILFYDFLVRSVRLNKFSLTFIIANILIKLLNLKKKNVDEAPKRFALKIGLLMSLTILILDLFNLKIYAIYLTTILFICAFLEAFFNYCIGCKIYQLLQKIHNV